MLLQNQGLINELILVLAKETMRNAFGISKSKTNFNLQAIYLRLSFTMIYQKPEECQALKMESLPCQDGVTGNCMFLK